MPVPAGYTLDQPQGVKLPAGYTLDAPTTPNTPTVAAAPSKPAPQGFFSSALDSSGLSSLGSAIMHPYKTIAPALGLASDALHGRSASDTNPIVQAVRGIVNNTKNEGGQAIDMAKQGSYGAAASHALLAAPIVGGILQKAMDQTQGDTGSYGGNLKSLVANPGAMGTLVGSVAGAAAPELIKPALPFVGRGLQVLGDSAQDGGISLMNRTVGALQKDFKRGANPSRGYFNAGGGPALSMDGLAEQAANAKAQTGQAMGDIRQAATDQGYLVPSDKIRTAIQSPIDNARGILSGPGGPGGANPSAMVDAYSEGFLPTLQKLDTSPGLTPNEVFDLKRGIAQNTSWGDPTQIGLRQLRQQQVGALGATLNDNLPYGEHAQNYADLSNFSTRAGLRAATGSQPLTHLAAEATGAGIGAAAGGPLGAVGGILANSIPVKSTLASGLFYGGKGLKAIGGKLLPDLGPSVMIPPASSIAPQLMSPRRLLTGTD
jgi:hypothetical protein